MPRSNDYPQWRYVAMQASMWIILAAAVGVAALVGQFKRHAAAHVALADPIQLQTVTVRLPNGWHVSVLEPDGLYAIEPVQPPFQRKIMAQERDPNDSSFFERWLGGGSIDPSPSAGRSFIAMGPTTGTLTIFQTPVTTEDGGEDNSITRIRVRADGVLPSGHLLTIVLTALDLDGRSLPDDVALLKQIAATIRPFKATDAPEFRPMPGER